MNIKNFPSRAFFGIVACTLIVLTSSCCKRNYTTVSEKIERIDVRSSFK